jgi:hypothetical protein
MSAPRSELISNLITVEGLKAKHRAPEVLCPESLLKELSRAGFADDGEPTVPIIS